MIAFRALVRQGLLGPLAALPSGHAGVAYDGTRLWALARERERKRGCVVEKTASGKEIIPALPARE